MKTLKITLISVLTSLLLAGCGSSEPTAQEKHVLSALEATQNPQKDLSYLNQYFLPESRTMREIGAGLARAKFQNVSTVENVEIVDSTGATVTVKFDLDYADEAKQDRSVELVFTVEDTPAGLLITNHEEV